MLHRRLIVAVLLPCLLGASPLLAQPLNSERIEQTFGSYGIDVVYSEASLRISNLFSLHDGVRVTRTLALVGLPATVPAVFAEPHQLVLAGESIGATFQAAGWDVIKTQHAYFSADAPAAVAAGMQLPAGTPLAAHAYRLELAQDGRRYQYALIIELHHPDYLQQPDLREIYGDEVATGVPETTQGLLDRGMERFDRYGLTLGEQ
jgi:hypothetical protein